MKLPPVIAVFIPWYGAGVRFRVYLRLREFFRIHHMEFLATCLKSHLQSKYGCEIAIHAQISTKVQFMHTVGVIIGEGCVLEDFVSIYGDVVIGRKNVQDKDDYPVIKKGTVLGSGCKVLGKVVVEENTIIGAGAIVLSSCIPANGMYVGAPALRVSKSADE